MSQPVNYVERLRKQRERERLANEKEQVRLFHEHQEQEVESRNRVLDKATSQISNLLSDAATRHHRLKFEQLKTPLLIPNFDPYPLNQAEKAPALEDYRPLAPGFFARLIPGVKARYQIAVREARIKFEADVAAHGEREKLRLVALQTAEEHHLDEVTKLKENTARQHSQVDALRLNYEAGKRDAVQRYCKRVLSDQSNPDGWPKSLKIAFVPESKQIVVEYDFPRFDFISEIAAYKYVKAKKEITTTRRPEAERRRLYGVMIAQATLRVIHILFDADYARHIESVVFNGHVDTIDPATGHRIHPCLVTLRTTRAVFLELDLMHVDAETCLKALNASVSKTPTELAPVKPVLEFSMVDPRFVKEEEILAGLDNRTNLMNLNPREFESLITNLFTKMGLESRQTRPSRDGGVDCVAYDPRPIFGGKVVIQAKRYKNTVGVSAVRDLYGTVQNEGASKGILVTTSGYGRASFEFANGKPLELLDGSNLLYLLAEHAGIEAKIEIPEDWKDPSPVLGE
jgi:restriction system protein